MLNKKALVVGINEYPDSPLSGCVSDALKVATLLERNGDNSVNFSVNMLTDTQVGTKGKLKGAIRDCFSGDEEVSLFYFSGHGFIDAIGGYIVTPDYSEDDWGVSMEEILTIINKSECRNKVVILDCCYAGFLGTATSIGQTAIIQEGVTILSASRSTEPSIETGGQSVFTALLLDALAGGASDITGHITPGGIYAYVDKALGPWKQRPMFKTNVSRFCSIRDVKPQVENEVLHKLIEYFPDPKKPHQLDPSYEPTNSLLVDHKVIEPYADPNNVKIFRDMQKLESIGLVAPCDEEHLYFAAMNLKACRLTCVGQHYWRLVYDKVI